jgi:hypothetical protein
MPFAEEKSKGHACARLQLIPDVRRRERRWQLDSRFYRAFLLADRYLNSSALPDTGRTAKASSFGSLGS